MGHTSAFHYSTRFPGTADIVIEVDELDDIRVVVDLIYLNNFIDDIIFVFSTDQRPLNYLRQTDFNHS